MGFSTEFIVDQVLKHDEIHGFEDAIAVIKARIKILHSGYPNGYAYHAFHKVFPTSVYTLETFTPIDAVTDAMMEQWCMADINTDVLNNIFNAALPFIKMKHNEHGLTVHYQNPDAIPTPQ
jgi:hypothetical protein